MAAAATDAVKSTVDQFTAASNVAFKDGVEKTLSALNEANGVSKKNLEAVVASVTAATKGAEALGAQAMAYSKTSFEAQVSAAKSLAGAKSVQEVVELQTTFAKTALEAYMAEMGPHVRDRLRLGEGQHEAAERARDRDGRAPAGRSLRFDLPRTAFGPMGVKARSRDAPGLFSFTAGR